MESIGIPRRNLFVAAGAAAAAAPGFLLGQNRKKPNSHGLDAEIISACMESAQKLVQAHQGLVMSQHDVENFVALHRLGITHLKKTGYLDEAAAFLQENRNNFPLSLEQATQAQQMFQAYSGETVDIDRLRMLPTQASIDYVLAIGLDQAAYMVLEYFRTHATQLTIPAQEINQMQQIANALMVTGAFWGLGAFVGCVVCGVGGALLGIGGLILCWAFC